MSLGLGGGGALTNAGHRGSVTTEPFDQAMIEVGGHRRSSLARDQLSYPATG